MVFPWRSPGTHQPPESRRKPSFILHNSTDHALPLLVLAGCSDYKILPPDEPESGDEGETETGTTLGPTIDSGVSDDSALPSLECPLHPSGDLPTLVPNDACIAEPEPGGFEPVVEWAFEDILTHVGDPNSKWCYDLPVVADLSHDEIPDIALVTHDSPSGTGWLRVVSGDGSRVHFSLDHVMVGTERHNIAGTAGIALGDIDADGSTDIVTITSTGAVLTLEGNGNLKWLSEWTSSYGTIFDVAYPALADMDGDGLVEIVMGNTLLNSAGNLIFQGDASSGGGVSDGLIWTTAFPVDIDRDGAMELIAGDTVYAVDGHVEVQGTGGDGQVAVGNFDTDAQGEWVVVRWEADEVTLYDTNGAVIWATTHPGHGGGAPTVADFDGDGLPEVGVAGRDSYAVFDTDGAVLWEHPIVDLTSSRTGSSVFDFEGDGKAEVVFADEKDLWILDGTTGVEKLNLAEHGHRTALEYPLVVDVDGDGSTEVLLMSWNRTNGALWNGLRVIGDRAASWEPARPIWNQYAYHITNIEDDGSIPSVAAINWDTYNSFRAAQTEGPSSLSQWDLVVGEPESCTDSCDDFVRVWIPISNAGLVPSPPTALSLVASDGLDLGEVVMEVPIPELDPAESRWIGPLDLNREDWGTALLIAMVNTEGDCAPDDNKTSLLMYPCL
jgi:hypothetical protein